MSKLSRWLPFRFRRKEKARSGHEVPVETRLARSRPTHGVSNAPLFPSPAEMMRAFFDDPFFGDPIEPFGPLAGLERWFGDFSPGRFSPPIEISDEPDALKVTAELPGISKDDLKVEVEGETLVLRGEKRTESHHEEGGLFRTERYYGSFQRAIPLPSDLDFGRAEASFRDGILSVRLPKLEPTKSQSRTIPISA